MQLILVGILMMHTCQAKLVAIVTGGTRGIGLGIARALASKNFDLLLTYNQNVDAAKDASMDLKREFCCDVECVGGDITLSHVRDSVFAHYDKLYAKTHDLGAMIHNAGQYVGITSANSENLSPESLSFGDQSLLSAEGQTSFSTMHYYQRMYGDAYIDMCEQSLVRMSPSRGGSLIGISSPGCTLQYKPQLGYDMPGSGKCIMEYAMRLYALRCGPMFINSNVVIPGVTHTEAWDHLAERRDSNGDALVASLSQRVSSMGQTTPGQIGEAVAFLCSPEGRMITGISLPVDGGVHLKA